MRNGTTIVLAVLLLVCVLYQAEGSQTVSENQRLYMRRQNRLRTISRLENRGFIVLEIHRVEATAYAIGDGHTPGKTTRSGRPAKKGSIAVDQRVIPLDSELYVPNYGWGKASDTGGAIKGNRIDVFLTSSKQASDYGRQKLDVYVIMPRSALFNVLMKYLDIILRPVAQVS